MILDSVYLRFIYNILPTHSPIQHMHTYIHTYILYKLYDVCALSEFMFVSVYYLQVCNFDICMYQHQTLLDIRNNFIPKILICTYVCALWTQVIFVPVHLYVYRQHDFHFPSYFKHFWIFDWSIYVSAAYDVPVTRRCDVILCEWVEGGWWYVSRWKSIIEIIYNMCFGILDFFVLFYCFCLAYMYTYL